MSDISHTLEPDSQQLDSVDLIGGERLFTVTKVDVRQSKDQPISVHLAEFPRPWKPGKNMRRVLGRLWGLDSKEWAGRQVILFCDDTVQYGGQAVGGVRIKAMSHIGDKPKSAPIIPTQGRSAMYPVQPLKNAPTPAPQQPDDTATLTAAIASEGIETALMPAFLAWASEKQLGRRVGHPSELTAADRGDLLDNLPALAADFLAEVARQGEGAES